MNELADAVDDLRLVRLQVADEVPAKRVSVFRVFRLEVLRAVFADDLDTGLGKHAHFGERHVFRRRDDRHTRADLRAYAGVALAHFVRRDNRSPPGAR